MKTATPYAPHEKTPGARTAAIRRRHSVFTDPQGPLLTPDFHIAQRYQGGAL
jgi:hypothetical protein